jgi:hypothetical protein
MELFKHEDYVFVCDSANTRNGFKHECTIFKGSWQLTDKVKINYINRTWESYRYKSVMQKAVDSIKDKAQKELLQAVVERGF